MKRQIKTFFVLWFMSIGCALAQTLPTVSPTMTIEVDGQTEETTDYSGSAPVVAHFKANATNTTGYQAYYQWSMYLLGKEASPYIVRYEADIDYTFLKAELSYISLTATFVMGTDTIIYTTEQPFSVSVSSSKLEMPNAFSPNGDGINDVYKVKDGYQSIIEFKGYIFNRWGKKVYEWSDIDGGWDGTISGSPAKEGVYFCLIKAKGADGKDYNIKKDVNLLRKYLESSTTTN